PAVFEAQPDKTFRRNVTLGAKLAPQCMHNFPAFVVAKEHKGHNKRNCIDLEGIDLF
ncbi:hypothetical protein ACJX0J_030554, partial [Zea mays]